MWTNWICLSYDCPLLKTLACAQPTPLLPPPVLKFAAHKKFVFFLRRPRYAVEWGGAGGRDHSRNPCKHIRNPKKALNQHQLQLAGHQCHHQPRAETEAETEAEPETSPRQKLVHTLIIIKMSVVSRLPPKVGVGHCNVYLWLWLRLWLRLRLWPSLPSAFNAQHIHVSKDNFGFMACEIPGLKSDDNGDVDQMTHSGRTEWSPLH